MDDDVLVLFYFQMGDVESPDRVQRQFDRLFRVPDFAGSEAPADVPQRPQHLRAVEPLALAMIAVAHSLILHPVARVRDGWRRQTTVPAALAGRLRRDGM